MKRKRKGMIKLKDMKKGGNGELRNLGIRRNELEENDLVSVGDVKVGIVLPVGVKGLIVLQFMASDPSVMFIQLQGHTR
jgi:hypothetical protein